MTDLEPRFLKREDDSNFRYVDSVAEADGILFLCPKCFLKNGGSVGTHAVICWDPSVPQTTHPVPGRWDLVGTGLHDLSLVAGSSSIKLPSPTPEEEKAGKGPCGWHGHITGGDVTGV